MAKVAVLVPFQEMCDIIGGMIGRYGNIEPMCVECLPADRLAERAAALERQGCDLIISRGLYARLAKHAVRLPVVEISVTAQELAGAVIQLRDALGSDRPRIALVGFANMLCDTARFDELFSVRLERGPVELGPGDGGDILQRSAEALKAAARRAWEAGCEAVIGGEAACEEAARLGLPSRLIPAGEESLRNALDVAGRVCYAIDLEKSNSAEMDAMLNHTLNGIMQVDQSGIVLRANRAMLNLLRRSARDVLGKGVRQLLPALSGEVLQGVLTEGKEAFAVLIPVLSTQTVANITPILLDQQVSGAILTFQEEQHILEMDSELRRELYLQGYVARFHFDQIPAENPDSRRVLELASRMARYAAPVLMTGEAGCGKHIIAQCIHNASPARGHAYIPLDCNAYHPDTLDTMLFGNYSTRKDTPACLAEIAQDGTVYLAHVDALSPELQYKLLNLIRGSFIHNGSNRPSAVNVRVIASTDVNLIPMVERGAFRSDLYYTLSVLGFGLQPLRRRKEDVPGWVEFYLKQWQERYKRYVSLTQGARQWLEAYDWPGNLDQVDSLCERIVLLAERRSVDEGFLRRQLEHLAPMIVSDAGQVVVFKDRRAVQIAELLRQHNGSRQKVAEALGVSKTTLWRYMKKYGIDRDFSY